MVINSLNPYSYENVFVIARDGPHSECSDVNNFSLLINSIEILKNAS